MKPKRLMSVVATGLAVAAVVLLCTLPLYSVTDSSVSSDGTSHSATGSQTVLQVMGDGYVVMLLLPVLVVAIPLLFRGRAASVATLVAAVLVSGFVVLGIMSIGLFYAPAAVCAIIAAAVPTLPARRP